MVPIASTRTRVQIQSKPTKGYPKKVVSLSVGNFGVGFAWEAVMGQSVRADLSPDSTSALVPPVETLLVICH